MQQKNRWMIRHGAKGLAVLPVMAVCLLTNIMNPSSGKTPQTVYAENRVYHTVPDTVITSEVSFESSFETQIPQEMETDRSGISMAVSVASDFEEVEKPKPAEKIFTPSVSTTNLDSFHGVFHGPSGKETYYNLPMSGVVKIMRRKGYDEQSYPYWVREDGVKMFGDYVMVAADLSTRPKGTILECSLGTAMVVDTGEFVNTNPMQLDIAVAW